MVFGFNSAGYDVKLIKMFLFKKLCEYGEQSNFTVKRAGKYSCMKTEFHVHFAAFNSWIIRRMICESMLSTKMQKLRQCTAALVNQTALRALCFLFLNKLTHNMQARPWSLVSILALPPDV